MLEIANVSVPLDAWTPGADTQGYLRRIAAKRLGVKPDALRHVELLRRGIDARKKSDVHFVCTLAAEFIVPCIILGNIASDTQNAKPPANNVDA